MLSLCLTNYNRYEMLIESFQHVYNDERISEIVISDDHSDLVIYNKIVEFCKDKPKIRLFRNSTNRGMSENKRNAVNYARNEWCILFDSDNVLKPAYLDAFDALLKRADKDHYPLDYPNHIFCPDAALPEFNYKAFSGAHVSYHNVRDFIKKPMFDCLLNTCNYIVNRNWYIKTYKSNPEIKASDTIHFNYLHLKAGGWFFVVQGMQYFHRVHPGSGFLADVNYNMQQAEKTKRMIMNL